jgi:predicted metallopeptidase
MPNPQPIIDILVTRDGMSPEEAADHVHDVQSAMAEAIARGDFYEAEDIFEQELGLEPDYLCHILPL